MGAAVPIRNDIPAEELRRLARRETDGRWHAGSSVWPTCRTA
jgi:hypothetical protein